MVNATRKRGSGCNRSQPHRDLENHSYQHSDHWARSEGVARDTFSAFNIIKVADPTEI